MFTGYPDSEAHVLSRHADGDTLIYQVRWSGTNSGSFRGGPPTGKPVDLRIAYFFRFREEKIERITEYYDLATLLAQRSIAGGPREERPKRGTDDKGGRLM